jgi:hypothetical protein
MNLFHRLLKSTRRSSDDARSHSSSSPSHTDDRTTDPEIRPPLPERASAVVSEEAQLAETATDTSVSPPPESGPPGSVRLARERLEVGRKLFSDLRYNSAMDEIIAVLDVFPHNRDALDLAGTILYMCSGVHSPEKIRPSLSNDPLLDGLFSQCTRCRQFWPANPMYKTFGGQLTVMNPVGGRCPKCANVWCRECARSGIHLICPDCKANLEILKEPSGRKRGLGAAKHPDLRLRQVHIFKSPPEPRNVSSYTTMVLDALLPEAFDSDVSIQFRAGSQGADQTSAVAYAFVHALMQGLELSADHTFIEEFTDADGGKGIVVGIYEPKR